MADHVFDDALQIERLDGGEHGSRWQGTTHPAYWNMVGPFGGYTAAVVLNALLRDPARKGSPVTLAMTYAAPVRDGAFTIVTQLVSATRSTQHWSIQLLQGSTVAVNAIALLATRRPVWTASEAVMPTVPPSAQTARFERGPESVIWVRQYAFFPITGGFDALVKGQPVEESTTQQWVRDEPARPLDFASLASICDVFFPRIFLRRGGFVPAGTVSLNIHFHADDDELARVGTQPVLGVAKAGRFAGGFFDQDAQIWSEDGALLASTQQMVWYKE